MNPLPLVTILTPTYNDVNYLNDVLRSIAAQTYKNWQHIIINDGSTDETKQLLDTINDNRILVIHQNNRDQLNAIKTSLPYVKGDFITFMHSDDMFVSETSLEKLVQALADSPEIDGVVADIVKINASGRVQGSIKVLVPKEKKIIEYLMRNNGCNPLGDPFFVRKDAFTGAVVENYLNDNTVYYLGCKDQSLLNLKKVESWYKYRVFNENYIHSDIGKFVTLSGQFRTVKKVFTKGFAFVFDPAISKISFKVYRRFSIPLPFVFTSKTAWQQVERYYAIWADDLIRRGYPEILVRIARKISNSAKTLGTGKSTNILRIHTNPKKAYYPADARMFYSDLVKGVVDPWYFELLDREYDQIVCDTRCYALVVNAMNFFSFFYPVVVSSET